MSALKRKQTDTVSPPATIRSIRRRHQTETMSQNKAIGNSNATDATEAVTGVPEQEEGPQLQFGFFGIPQVTLPQINLRTESGGDLDLTYAISHLLANPAFTTALAESLVPLITPALSASLTTDVNATVTLAVQKATLPLKQEVSRLTKRVEANESVIAKLSEENSDLTARVQSLESTVEELEYNIEENYCTLESGLEELEQYGRRNSLRFHNVKLPYNTDSDDAIVKLCAEKLNVEIEKDDICRSHPIGNENRRGNYQVICRFRNWKIKNTIFSNKSQLKDDPDRIFITEDLTSFRQEIVAEMVKAKRAHKIHSFWTNDGRIFMKVTESGYVHRVESLDHLRHLAPPSDEYAEYDTYIM